MLESPFAVGVITLMGSWYTPQGMPSPIHLSSCHTDMKIELGKRIAIFYSASYAASMFSGYLQAGIYKGLDGHLGLPGWRWLFIFCGIISLPAPLWGLYAIPDNPYTTRARWLSAENKQLYIKRMQQFDIRAPVPLSWAKIRRMLMHWPIYVVSLMLMFVSFQSRC
jgi:ACS family pantothenate transporter-like MFS transporter